MKNIIIENIVSAVNGQLIAENKEKLLKKNISSISKNSKEILPDSLYIPIIGERFDGHDFILESLEKGAVISFSQKEIILPNHLITKNKGIIMVEDTRVALLNLARYYRSLFQIPFVAITGSVGKTTTKDMINSVASVKYNTLATKGNLNNDIGVPFTIFELEDEHEIAIIEMGMNHANEIHVLAETALPDIGVISNVGVAHIENLGSRENILNAKLEIFDFMDDEGTAILNGDDDMLNNVKNKLPQKITWFGMESTNTIFACNIENTKNYTTKCKIITPIGNIDVELPIAGIHMVSNALSATAVGLKLDMDIEDIKTGLENFIPSKNRMNIINKEDGTVIIDDVYNANPVSMQASISSMSALKGRKIAILGHMGELGEFAPKMHEELGEFIAKNDINMAFFIGEFAEEVVSGCKSKGFTQIFAFKNHDDLWDDVSKKILPKDVILVKASRSMKLETIVEKLQGVK